MSTLCLGEVLVELICRRRVEDVADVDAFVPTFGGAVATAAVVAARHGARVALAGGAGQDDWGEWLRDRLEDEGVDLERFSLVAGEATPITLVTVDGAGEPTYRTYGDGIATVAPAPALASRVAEAVEASDALFFASGTLVGETEREVTMQARELALERDRPVVFDAAVRLDRWPSRAEAAASANACVPGALLVRANLADAALMTGEADPQRAASAFLKAGARLVVITMGARGAMLRGELDADVPAPDVEVLSTVGAGDVLTGVLLARLAVTGFYPPAVAASLSEAVAEAGEACERWGPLE
jgi:sugar/nucleoside kinase (ribokinase family)